MKCTASGFHFTKFAKHWCTIDTCKQVMEWPSYESVCKSRDLPTDQKLVWLIGCWCVHTGDDLEMIKVYP